MQGPRGVAVSAVHHGVAAARAVSVGHRCAGDLADHQGDSGDRPWEADSGDADVVGDDLLRPMLVSIIKKFEIGGYSTISLFLEEIKMEHIELIYSSKSKLFFVSSCSIRNRSRN